MESTNWNKNLKVQSLFALRQYVRILASQGNRAASMRARAVVNAAAPDLSTVVQLALAIEMIESINTPSPITSDDPLRTEILPLLQQDLTHLCCGVSHSRNFQRIRACELLELKPVLLKQISYGFTPKLSMGDRAFFVNTMIRAGKRELPKADEQSAIDEDENKVFQVALSYKHVYPRGENESTISKATAEEAFEIITSIPGVDSNTIVRVWIDQNLHRYNNAMAHGNGQSMPWYEIGFLPYLLLTVVSALGDQGGFETGLTRPWIWVETGAAMYSNGIYCKPSIIPSLHSLIHIPEDTTVFMNSEEGYIRGFASSMSMSITYILTCVSLWTTDVLHHREYNPEYIPAFKEFCMWARAQLTRIRAKGGLSLNNDKHEEDGVLEKISWIRSLPRRQARAKMAEIYMRIEYDTSKCTDLIALLKSVGECRRRHNVFELKGGTGTAFCFEVKEDKTFLNVNPDLTIPVTTRLLDGLQNSYSRNLVHELQERTGAFSNVDRANRGEKLKHIALPIGKIFDRPYCFVYRTKQLSDTVELGGVEFCAIGRKARGMEFERVYDRKCADSDESPGTGDMNMLLSETDVMCISELPLDLQKEIVEGLSVDRALPSMRRIVKIENDVTVDEDTTQLSIYTLGSTGRDILDVMEKNVKMNMLSHEHEINVTRIRMNAMTYWMTTFSETLPPVQYVFTVRPSEPFVEDDLIAFNTGGNVVRALDKISCLMGNVRFWHHRNNTNPNYKYELNGSEFRFCDRCGHVYCPINRKIVLLYTHLSTRLIQVVFKSSVCVHNYGVAVPVYGMASFLDLTTFRSGPRRIDRRR